MALSPSLLSFILCIGDAKVTTENNCYQELYLLNEGKTEMFE